MCRQCLSGGGASSSVVRIGIMGHVGGDDEYSGGNPYKLPKADHREWGTEKHRRDVGNTGGRRDVEGSWNADSGHICRPQAGTVAQWVA